MRSIALVSGIIVLIIGIIVVLPRNEQSVIPPAQTANPSLTSPPSPSPTPTPLPEKVFLANDYHVFQTFNNCGPAALSMMLTYYDLSVSQKELGDALRPYQVPGGNNDDKSVTLDELEEKSKEYGLIPYHRPAGSLDKIRQFLTAKIPVMTRTLLHADDDIGHYRIIKGYDDTTREFIQDDSLQGKNLRYLYGDYLALWKPYNYEYLVLVPKDKEPLARQILGDELDEQTAWEHALSLAKNEQTTSDSFYPVLNESVALYHLGRYDDATKRFEAVESRLPFRTLWYQIEPILAYQQLKNYDRVLALSDQILHNYNRAFSELYYIRGQVFEEKGESDQARSEYEKAVYYNKNFKPAEERLAQLAQ
ncbi:MAG: C39 family peptidase [bacterium]|nr:C39 family peptidase [bacterium]